ncbi:competence protein CoiA [Deinococcus ruber]|uniref:Competence protein CoiA nuclease-like domain-containing protein n=1 Tax=Deinococcus ruber TaxID=1848197 RepID=A0A918CN76_9DEIO|nr:competence protein CoiA family protein [Deinococcus ruber]GGR30238.1 hypothetical protein GCM10008957_46290 [Deinococcus ruber]
MPLKAQKDGDEVVSFTLTNDAFDALRGDPELRMACCSARAIPKRSKLGTPFFAHGRTGECSSGPETAFHLQSKVIIAQAAEAAGWQAIVEASGQTPDGTPWRADVLCTKGKANVAFEVQRSPQTIAETAERQAIYERSEVRGLWLMTRHRKTLEDRIWLDKSGEYTTPIFFLDDTFQVPRFNCSLHDFITGSLSGQLLYAPRAGQRAQLSLHGSRQSCWKCRKQLMLILELGFQVREHVRWEVPWMYVVEDDDLLQLLEVVLLPELCQRLQIGQLKRRPSKTTKTTYLSQGCPHCDALQGNYFIDELRQKIYRSGTETKYTQVIPLTQITLKESLASWGNARWQFRME